MRRATLIVGVLFATACGYRFVRPGGDLPTGRSPIYVPVVTNATAEPGAESWVTQALRDEVNRAGLLGDASSEVTLVGTLVSVSGEPMIASPGKLSSYRASASLALELRSKGVAVSGTQLSASEEYPPGGDLLLTEANRSAALRRLAQVLARDAWERIAVPVARKPDVNAPNDGADAGSR